MTFGDRLRGLREQKGVPQKEVAAAVGIHINQIRWYEQDRHEPTVSRLVWLADYYEVDLNWLTGRNYPIEKGKQDEVD